MPGCEWLPDAPAWESAVYDPRGGYRINVFDWAVKKLSEYGVDDGYAMKVKVCVGMYEDEWHSLEQSVEPRGVAIDARRPRTA